MEEHHLIFVLTRLDAGGIERFCVTTANAWVAKGWRCTVTALYPARSDKSLKMLASAVTYRELRRPAKLAALKLRELCKSYPQAKILALGAEIGVVLAALKSLKQIGNAVFYRESTDLFSYYSKFWLKLIRWMTSRIDGVFAQSNQAIADLQRLSPKLPKERIHLLRNGCDFTLRQCARQNGAKSGRDNSALQVLCVGRLEAMKGHARLLSAWPLVIERYKNARLLIAGEGSLLQALEKEVAARGLTDSVRFCGHVADVWSLYEQSDVLVLPSDYEGLPNVVVEALVTACPVVATGKGGTRELLIETGVGEFWLELDEFEKGLVDAIGRALVNRDVWQEASRRVREMVALERVVEIISGGKSEDSGDRSQEAG